MNKMKLICTKCSKKIDVDKPFMRIRAGIEPLKSEQDIKDMSFHLECSPLIFKEQMQQGEIK